MTAYIHDVEQLRKTNQSEKNYWDTYIKEINELLGLRAESLSLSELEDINNLKNIRVLIIGSVSGEELTDRMTVVIDEWVKTGGILIGFAVNGMDNIFGMETVAVIRQEPDDYAINAYFELRPHQITHEIHPALYLEQRLFCLSDIRLIKARGSVELARFYDTEGRDLKCPAITWNSYYSGYAGYFSIRFKCNCLYESGMIVKIPVNDCSELQVLCDGSTAPFKEKNEFGRTWVYFVIATGKHDIELTGISI